MSRVGVYQLQVVKVDPNTHEIEKSLAQREFLGSYQEVRSWADVYLKELSAEHPESKYTVEPLMIEEIHPRALFHLRMAMAQRDTNALLAQVLAGQVAALQAREQIEINPDLTTLAAKVLHQAAETVSQIQAAQAGIITKGKKIAEA